MLWVILIDVLLESWETEHISIFKVAVIIGVLLYGIIREMDECVINILKVDSELAR